MMTSQMILDFLTEIKPQISYSLENLIRNEQQHYRNILSPMHSAFSRSIEFSKTGKMIRGALVILLSNGYKSRHESMPIAVSMELFQSFLLIHDDIMDRDPIRRGNPAIYVQYASDIQVKNSALPQEQANHYGEALGICVGDVVSFLGYQAITGADLPDSTKIRLLQRVNYELTRVGLAQMQDVAWGASVTIPDSREIYQMYVNKTGRYTFTLPLLLGGILGDASETDLSTLERLGDTLGILFQIKDDELGILGNPDITGKPRGSDLRENKKTIFLSTLLEKVKDDEREQVLVVLSKGDKTDEDIEFLTGLMALHGVFSNLELELQRLAMECDTLIDSLSLGRATTSDILKSLVHYCAVRDK